MLAQRFSVRLMRRSFDCNRRLSNLIRNADAGSENDKKFVREWPPLDTLPPVQPVPVQTLDKIPELTKDDPYYASLQHEDYFGVAELISVPQMMEARVHLGHKVGTLDPRMKPFLLGERLGVCVFDLHQTAFHLRQALNFIAHMAYRDGIILFLGGDSWNIHAIEMAAKEAGEFSHCREYKPGTLLDSRKAYGGVFRLPDAAIFMSCMNNAFNEHPGIEETAKLCIPSVAVVDSNCNPNLVTYPIPGNDDSPVTVKYYLKLFKEAVLKGKQKAKLDFNVDNTSIVKSADASVKRKQK